MYIQSFLFEMICLHHFSSFVNPDNIFMFQFFSSFGASTAFEKYRLQITARNFQAPTEQSLRGIVQTFSGRDPETKSQIAFATIVKKLLTSDSKNNWLYILKNLIIFDRIVQEGFFVEEVNDLEIATIDGFKQTDQKYFALDSERVISSFWRLIKEKSKVLAKDDHIFRQKRSHRTQFLSKLKHNQILAQIQTIQRFFALTFEFVSHLSGKKLISEQPQMQQRIERGRDEWQRSRLLEYLYLQVLHKLMLFYSCQLLCHQAFLPLIPKDHSMKVQQVRQFKQHVLKFRQNANQYVRFVQVRKIIKGFEEINYKELNPYKGDDIIRLLDAFIHQKDKEADSQRPVFELLLNDGQMRVQKKPLSNLNKETLVPRLKLKEKDVKQPFNSNSFINWSNSYSNSFPQSEVLSVDLIMQIRKEEGKQNMIQLQVLVDDSNRQSVMYDYRDTNITSNYQITHKMMERGKPLVFDNQYSALTSKWNS